MKQTQPRNTGSNRKMLNNLPMIKSVNGRSIARNSQCLSPLTNMRAQAMVSPKIRRSILSPVVSKTSNKKMYNIKVTSTPLHQSEFKQALNKNFHTNPTEICETSTKPESREDANIKKLEILGLSEEWKAIFTGYLIEDKLG